MVILNKLSHISQAHKLILATKSSWFHQYFKKMSKQSYCDIVFFNINESVVKTCISLIYGKEVVVSHKEKNRIISFLSKLGVKWVDCSESSDNTQRDDPVIQPLSKKAEIGISIIFRSSKSTPFNILNISSSHNPKYN